MLIEQSLRFAFKASNNQAEYEALIAAMLLAREMGARSLVAKNDSLLVTGQVPGERSPDGSLPGIRTAPEDVLHRV